MIGRRHHRNRTDWRSSCFGVDLRLGASSRSAQTDGMSLTPTTKPTKNDSPVNDNATTTTTHSIEYIVCHSIEFTQSWMIFIRSCSVDWFRFCVLRSVYVTSNDTKWRLQWWQ